MGRADSAVHGSHLEAVLQLLRLLLSCPSEEAFVDDELKWRDFRSSSKSKKPLVDWQAERARYGRKGEL